mmetsp:Transcript_3560/g.11045  ORF Transcript_3560/g.11045 Transcript_3560/m.11045 type:complete len:281 (+) Transcript_3560:628-1470(+)
MAALGASLTADWRDLPRALPLAPPIRAAPRLVVFLDYDGTLTPIVAHSSLAVLAESMRAALRRLADKATVAVVSGRARENVEALVDAGAGAPLYFAGSHGFDIAGPNGLRHAVAGDAAPALEAAARRLAEEIAEVPGARVEATRFSVSVHWRGVAEADRPRVETAVDAVLAAPRFAGVLRKHGGKCVFELRPAVAWDKGAAVLYLLELLGNSDDVLPVYVGDDTTDEAAFRALAGRDAVSVLVAPADASERPAATHATHTLRDVAEVQLFIEALAASCDG